MKKRQTALEWYNTQLNLYGDMAFNKVISLGEYHIKKQELLEQAKQMEKEEIMGAVKYGYSDWGSAKDAEQYYNETFGGNNE
jgi:hypothetical protein